jgi:hypothetical protein
MFDLLYSIFNLYSIIIIIVLILMLLWIILICIDLIVNKYYGYRRINLSKTYYMANSHATISLNSI